MLSAKDILTYSIELTLNLCVTFSQMQRLGDGYLKVLRMRTRLTGLTGAVGYKYNNTSTSIYKLFQAIF